MKDGKTYLEFSDDGRRVKLVFKDGTKSHTLRTKLLAYCFLERCLEIDKTINKRQFRNFSKQIDSAKNLPNAKFMYNDLNFEMCHCGYFEKIKHAYIRDEDGENVIDDPFFSRDEGRIFVDYLFELGYIEESYINNLYTLLGLLDLPDRYHTLN